LLSADVGNDPRPGFDLNYGRDLAHLGWGRFGIKLAFGYTDLNIRDDQPATANVSLITDAYSLGGVTPPIAPYSGSFSGPGPVIGDTPTRTTAMIPGGASITSNQRMDATLYDWRLGPYLELPLISKLTCQVGGGLAVGLVSSTFSFSDNTTTSAGTVQVSGSNHRLDSLVGFYAEAQLAYSLVPEASLLAGGQFQYLGEFNQSAVGQAAQLDLRRSIFFLVGIQWHF
jgi:hypothetical protein